MFSYNCLYLVIGPRLLIFGTKNLLYLKYVNPNCYLDTVIPVGRMVGEGVGVFETSPPQLEADTGLQHLGAGQVATEVLPRPTRLTPDKQGHRTTAEILEDHPLTGETEYL